MLLFTNLEERVLALLQQQQLFACLYSSSFSFSIIALLVAFVLLDILYNILTCARFHVKCVYSFYFLWIFHICVSTIYHHRQQQQHTIQFRSISMKCVDKYSTGISHSIFGMLFLTAFIPFLSHTHTLRIPIHSFLCQIY